jgi:Cof subfamily protein (haloacid dehalogenase superfamily)
MPAYAAPAGRYVRPDVSPDVSMVIVRGRGAEGRAEERIVPDVRLIACDLDGTLLRSDGTLSGRTSAALAAARAAGIVTAIATGRPRPLAEPIGRLAGVDLVVCLNGTQTVALPEGDVLVDHVLPEALAAEAFASVRAVFPTIGLGVEFGDDTMVYEHWFLDAVPLPPPDTALLVDRLESAVIDRPVRKFVLGGDGRSVDEVLAGLAGRLPEDVGAAHAGLPFTEIGVADVSKATALGQAIARLGGDASHVVAFGDGRNDHEMLAWAGFSVVMSHADAETRALADEIALSNDDDGVAIVIERLLGL